MISEGAMGHHPRSRRISRGSGLPLLLTIKIVATALIMQESVTARILARMTDGESRDSSGDGLVVELR